MRRTMSEQLQRVRVEVVFEGEELASFTDATGTSYRLFRYDGDDEPGFFVHMQDELGAWLETGRHGSGMTRAEVAQLWPELVENLHSEG
jgi:hypothetical protein